MAKAQELLYAAIGAGDLAVAKVRGIALPDRKAANKLYKDSVKRGRSLATKIRNSAPTKQAIEQTKTARSQLKAAATSVGKVVQASTSGNRTQAREQTKTARTQVKAAATSVTKAVGANARATRSAASKVAKVS